MDNDIVETIDAINNEIELASYSSMENKNIESIISQLQLFDINNEILNAHFFAAQPKPKPYEETIKIPFQF